MVTAPGVSEIEIDFTGVEVRPIVIVIVLDGAGGDVGLSVWTAYYLGYQYGWLIVISQFMAVPLYYLFYGVWKSNYPMVGTAALFLIFHTTNGFTNFVTQ